MKSFMDNISQDMDGEKVQELIFVTAREHDVSTRRFFSILYKVILGIDRGPRAGNLVSALGVERVKKMIKEVL